MKEEDIKKRQDALVVIIQQSNEEKQKAEYELAEQKAVFKGREVVLEERERIVSDKEKSFANREKAISLFLEDYDHGKIAGRYLNAELPKLDFQDKQFQLANTSQPVI